MICYGKIFGCHHNVYILGMQIASDIQLLMTGKPTVGKEIFMGLSTRPTHTAVPELRRITHAGIHSLWLLPHRSKLINVHNSITDYFGISVRVGVITIDSVRVYVTLNTVLTA